MKTKVTSALWFTCWTIFTVMALINQHPGAAIFGGVVLGLSMPVKE